MFLDHFRVWDEFKRYKLIMNLYDRCARTRYLFIDLTNQNQSQSNYLNDIVSAAREFSCTDFFINVNSASVALRNNIPSGYRVFFLDAKRRPECNNDGYEFYYHIYEPERGECEEPWGYVPQLNKCMSITDFEDYMYEAWQTY